MENPDHIRFALRWIDRAERGFAFFTAVAIFDLLVFSVLQVWHPPIFDHLLPVVILETWADSMLLSLAPWFGITWPPEGPSFFPIPVAFAIFVARRFVWGFADGMLRDYRADLRRITKEQKEDAWEGPRSHPDPSQQQHPPAGTMPVAYPPAHTLQAEYPQAGTMPIQQHPAGTVPVSYPPAGTMPVAPNPAAGTMPAGYPAMVSGQFGGLPVVDRYELIEELGRGAMGIVYKARDPRLDRFVAVKLILAADLTGKDLEEYRKRLDREAQAAGRLSHPGIVKIFDVTADSRGFPCPVFEFIDGMTLDEMVRKDPPSLQEVLRLAAKISAGLGHAHSRGIVHRDLKPSNILIDGEGQPKISDFGIAKLGSSNLTAAGSIIGTPAFASPEQVRGGAVDARSDVFSMGIVLYWLCTGETPFAGETLTATAYRVVHTEHVPAAKLRGAIPEQVDQMIARCLAKNPAERYATGSEFATDLEAYRIGATSSGEI